MGFCVVDNQLGPFIYSFTQNHYDGKKTFHDWCNRKLHKGHEEYVERVKSLRPLECLMFMLGWSPIFPTLFN